MDQGSKYFLNQIQEIMWIDIICALNKNTINIKEIEKKNLVALK